MSQRGKSPGRASSAGDDPSPILVFGMRSLFSLLPMATIPVLDPLTHIFEALSGEEILVNQMPCSKRNSTMLSIGISPILSRGRSASEHLRHIRGPIHTPVFWLVLPGRVWRIVWPPLLWMPEMYRVGLDGLLRFTGQSVARISTSNVLCDFNQQTWFLANQLGVLRQFGD